MLSHGRIVEICGERVERLYFNPLAVRGLPRGNVPDTAGGEPPSTVAFFGLVRSGDTLLTAGIDGLYRLRGAGAAHRVPLPDFREVDGARIADGLPGVILVLTGINQRVAMSGAVPLLVAR
jgi:hypothetical protein